MAKVIQADRDHAAELARTIKTHTCSERGNMIAGRDDDNALVQAFVSHREASIAHLQAEKAELVEAARMLLRVVDFLAPPEPFADPSLPVEMARSTLSRIGEGV